MVKYFIVKENETGQRLDNYLVRILKGVPKTLIYRLIRKGEVRVNMKRSQASTKLLINDSIRVPPIRTSDIKLKPTVNAKMQAMLNAAIIYEDASLIVINKPIGIAVHGGSGLSFGIIEALRQTRSDLSYVELIHRLDKDTSGCLLIAKKRSILKAIQALFVESKIQKTYLALLAGRWLYNTKSKVVKLALKKHVTATSERFMRVDKTGKESETLFTLCINHQECCLVEAKPKTGRMHQIRVHSASLGHAIIGDEKYGTANVLSFPLEKRLYLHAAELEFTLNERKFHFVSPLDNTFKQVIERIKT